MGYAGTHFSFQDLGGRDRYISEFETRLLYRVSSSTAVATQRDPVLKNIDNNEDKERVT